MPAGCVPSVNVSCGVGARKLRPNISLQQYSTEMGDKVPTLALASKPQLENGSSPSMLSRC